MHSFIMVGCVALGMVQITATFEKGDVVKAGSVFSGTVVKVLGDRVIVENRDGDREQFSHGDLKHTR